MNLTLPLDWPDPIDPPPKLARRPLPEALDPAALSWADESSDVARRRDARRIRMAYAGRLAREAGIDYRTAWKLIRQREECGDIILPANV